MGLGMTVSVDHNVVSKNGTMRNLLLRTLKIAVAFCALLLLVPSGVEASTGDLNCPDFGSRERAQYEMDGQGSDVYGLDGDHDGRACEWNGSTGWWSWPLASVALVAGRLVSRKKKADHRVVPGIEGVWTNYQFHEDGGVDKKFDRLIVVFAVAGGVALPVVSVLRDIVLPRSFTPLAINSLVAVLFGTISFAVNWYTNRIDEYR